MQVPWISPECRATNTGCIGAGCTASDVSLAVVEVLFETLADGSSTACYEGTVVVRSLKFKLSCGATQRYDIGIFCKCQFGDN